MNGCMISILDVHLNPYIAGRSTLSTGPTASLTSYESIGFFGFTDLLSVTPRPRSYKAGVRVQAVKREEGSEQGYIKRKQGLFAGEIT